MATFGARTWRQSRLLFGDWDASTPSKGDLALIEVNGEVSLAVIALTPNDLLNEAPIPATARFLSVGRSHPAVGAAVESRRQSTMEEARAIVGAELDIDDVQWSDDLGRLTLTGASRPTAPVEAIMARLARRFRAVARFSPRNG